MEQLDATSACGPSVSGRFHYPPSTFPSPVGIGRPTTCHQVYRTLLAVNPRDRCNLAQKRGDGHSSPCLQAGVSWPKKVECRSDQQQKEAEAWRTSKLPAKSKRPTSPAIPTRAPARS